MITTETIINIQDLTKEITLAKGQMVKTIEGVSLKASRGEFLSIVGPSGSGKTSLLQCMSGLSLPTSGEVNLLGVNPYKLSPSKSAVFRRTKIGFIFQSYNLVPALPAFENVILPLRLAGKKIDKIQVDNLLRQLHFSANPSNFVDALSGGEQQKIAIARVLLANSEIVFADEPTGALDSVSRKSVFDLLRGLADKGVCVVMVTHDIELAALTDRALVMKDGRLINNIIKPTATELFNRLNEVERV